MDNNKMAVLLEEAETNLRCARKNISELLDKAWEIGGYSVGASEYESWDWVKDARDTLELINEYFKNKANGE